jgi:hypothetical protein
MRAQLPTENTSNGKNFHGEKPFTMAFVIVDRLTGDQPVKAVVWHSQSKGSNYAAVWAHSRARSFAGHGRATGYGYHRPSAALGAAFDSAGVKLSEDIEGRGESAMKEACIALAVAMGYKAHKLEVVQV